MKILVEIELQNNDQIEGNNWPPFLAKYKDSGHIPQQVKSVKVFNHPIQQELGDMQRQAYKWCIFVGPGLRLDLVQEAE